jgi:hypothetical protein
LPLFQAPSEGNAVTNDLFGENQGGGKNDMSQSSLSLPWVLDGTMAGDVGFEVR